MEEKYDDNLEEKEIGEMHDNDELDDELEDSFEDYDDSSDTYEEPTETTQNTVSEESAKENVQQSRNPIKQRLSNYAENKKKEGQNKIDRAKKMVDDGNKKSESLKKQGDRINKLKDKMGDDPEKNKFAKSMLDKAAKSNDKKQKEQAEKNKSTAEKAEKLAKDGKKLVETGTKLAADIASGNVAGIAKDALELAKNDLLKKAIKNKIKIVLVTSAIAIMAIIVILSVILEPISNAIDIMKNGADNVEKVRNFMYGLGFKDSVVAFNDELEYLEKHYDGGLNEPLLMSTLFYDDLLISGNTTDMETSLLENGNSDDINQIFSSIYAIANEITAAGYTETDSNNIVYSANKIFRLKKLAHAMMSKDDDVEDTVSFSDYFGSNVDLLSDDVHNYYKSAITMLFIPILEFFDIQSIIAGTDMGQWVIENPTLAMLITNSPTSPIFLETLDNAKQNQYITNHMTADAIDNHFETLSSFFYDFFTAFTDITGIEIVIRTGDAELRLNTDYIRKIIELAQSYTITDISDLIDAGSELLETIVGDFRNLIDDIISFVANFDINDLHFDVNITYKKFSIDMDAYEDYLKTDYIPNMPEFKKHLTYVDGVPTEKSINAVYRDIKSLADAWVSVYGSEDSAWANDKCIGDIKQTIINQLSLPVNLEVGTIVNFTRKSAFGTNGTMHNGVDLNLESVGVDVGSPVFSIYNGEVIESTSSGNYPKIINGGGVRIQYSITYESEDNSGLHMDTTSTFIAEYEGLDPTSVPTVGTQVTAGQQIGTIGTANFSEDGVTPGLHFAFFDNQSNRYLNPVNMFITCYSDGDGAPLVHTNELRVHEIGISKSDFKIAIMRYTSEGNAPILKTWDLDLVYDVSRANNVNPELVVIRAIVEGFSPYSKGYQNKNNYWGIGCYNNAPLSVCTSYSSLSDGIAGFANLPSVRDSETIIDMMMNYVNIGAYWWKPGDSGAGGCYYFDAEQKYMSFAEAARVSAACKNPNYVCNNSNKNGCLPTNEEDQRAHASYNCEHMNSLYQRIFAPYHSSATSDRELDDVSNSIGSVPSNGEKIIDKDLPTFLEEHGSSLEEYANAITEAKNREGGSCTRKGAVAIAKKTLDYMKKFEAKLPYDCGGGWGYEIQVGPQSSWGVPYGGSGHCGTACGSKCYSNHGLDCAGFVRWVLNTDGFQIPAHEANGFGEGFLPGAVNVTLANVQLLKAGDIMFSSGHVVFIVGVDKANKRYIIAEAAGGDYGVQYSSKSFNASGYTGVNMDGFYTSPQACLN